MTLFVAICDDEKIVGSELESTLLDIFVKLNVKYEIDVYYTGEELCAKMGAGAHYDLIFLDIEFAKNAINGVEVGRIIRETYRNDLISIVYISWEMKYSMQLFDIRPLNFLIKPLNYAKIEQVLTTYLKIARLWASTFSYKIGHSTHKVQIKDIVYLHSDKRKLVLHLADGRKEEFYGILKEVYQEQLQRFDFIIIHHSCVVNFDYIAVAKYDEMILIDGTSLQISQPKRKEVKDVYYDITNRREG